MVFLLDAGFALLNDMVVAIVTMVISLLTANGVGLLDALATSETEVDEMQGDGVPSKEIQ